MEQHIIEAVWTALGIIVTSIVGYIAKALIKFIMSKHLELLAQEAVHFAEDAFKHFGGEKKAQQGV